tara:strand:+ start:1071 stop:1403 length:333 start_codon:yes stop_codon:yes gene_type:complete
MRPCVQHFQAWHLFTRADHFRHPTGVDEELHVQVRDIGSALGWFLVRIQAGNPPVRFGSRKWTQLSACEIESEHVRSIDCCEKKLGCIMLTSSRMHPVMLIFNVESIVFS